MADEGASLVQQAVNALRRRILAVLSSDDSFLGSEEDLIDALGVSRPTFRQAARLLEHEQLLKIKRGSGGGFFAQRPSARAVAHSAAIYLNCAGTSLQQLNQAFGPVVIEAASLLAGTAPAESQHRLVEFVEQHSGFESAADERTRLRVVLEFERLLGELCGNPAIALMLAVMRDLVRDARYSAFKLTRDRARQYAEYHRRLAEAIRAGDVEMARLFTRAHLTAVAGWEPDGAVAAPGLRVSPRR